MRVTDLNSITEAIRQRKTESMSKEKIVVLDGTPTGEENLTSILTILTDVLKQNGAKVQVFSLRNMKLAHCIGCFGCWLETPGICRFREPGGLEILKAIMQSGTIVLLTPVTFGGYSSQLKQIVDRFPSHLLPYFGVYHGEIHHRPRYLRYPRWVGIGVQESPNTVEANIFKLIVGRNAINLHAPSYAAQVISSTDNPDNLHKVFQSLLTRKDQLPRGKSVKPLMPPGEALANRRESDGVPRACLIVGSPKTLSNSTSSVLGNYLLDRLKEHGWETESLTLKTNLCTGSGEAALLATVDRADLLIFAFPLYVDALPFLMTRALELIAKHRRMSGQPRLQRLFAIANNGFPESYQNNLALSICRNFAASSDIIWMGSLAMGAGEIICGGEPLKPRSAQGFPLTHITGALNAAADALAQGQAVRPQAIRGIAKNPIPYTPFLVWRWLFTFNGGKWWQKRASGHGVDKQRMLARPYDINTLASRN
jgi:multimeric flavodoxin WrbA